MTELGLTGTIRPRCLPVGSRAGPQLLPRSPLSRVLGTLVGVTSLGLASGPGLLGQVKLGVIKSLKPMLNLLLPNDDLREQLYDYIPLLLAEYRGGLEALFVTQVRGRWPAA